MAGGDSFQKGIKRGGRLPYTLPPDPALKRGDKRGQAAARHYSDRQVLI